MTAATEPSAAFRPGAGTASHDYWIENLHKRQMLPGFAKWIIPRRPIFRKSLFGSSHFSAEV